MKMLFPLAKVATPFLLSLGLMSLASTASAQSIPNVTQPAPGTLIQGPIAQEMGRTTTIEYLGGYIIAIPEAAGSETAAEGGNDDLLVRAFDLTDPTNPVVVGTFDETLHPMNAHGTIKRGNQVYLGGAPNDGDRSAIEVDSSGNLSFANWRGPFSSWDRGGMMAPWTARGWWSYGVPSGNAHIELDGVRRAEWDHLGLTGVVGFPMFVGNLLIYGSDQSNTGVATYDVSDPDNPVLLDVFNTPASQGGIGGYWAEIYGHYVVFARRVDDSDPRTFAGIQVVDFSDPSNLRLHCNMPVGGENMYMGFQDEFIFSERFKVNIETCQTVMEMPVNLSVETSQYSRPIGNLLLTGGYPLWRNADGMGIWVHQSAPDTRGPFVSYHIPQNNQTNYPVNLPITLHIPETLRGQTVKVTETPELSGPETMTLTEVGGDPVRIDYIISHTGLITVDPVSPLRANTTYELSLTSGILDAAGNALVPYSFRFSTGSTVDNSDPDPVDPPAPDPDPVDPPAPDPDPVVDVPVISNVFTSPSNTVDTDATVTITVAASNTANESMDYYFEYQGSGSWQSSSSRNYQFSTVGSHQVTVRARNSGGESSSSTATVTVVEPAVAPPTINSVIANPSTGLEVNESVFISVSASHSISDPIEYLIERSDVGGGSWATNSSATFQFSSPGTYFIDVRARNRGGNSGLSRLPVTVVDSAVEAPPGHYSSQLYCDAIGGSVLTVNPDNNSVTYISADQLQVDNEHYGVSDPRSLTVDLEQNVWVAAYDGDAVEVFDSQGNPVAEIDTGYGSAPYGIVMSPDGSRAYVSLYGSGEVISIDTETRSIVATLAVGPTPRAMALTPDGSQLLVTRFISDENWGEVWQIDTASWSLVQSIRLDKHLENDDINEGRGVPNYLSAIIINSDGTRAYLVGKKDNVDRALVNWPGNSGLDLDDDNSVRTMAMAIDLQNGTELRDQRIDFDNADSPSALALSYDSTKLFVALQGINQVFVVNLLSGQLGSIAAQIGVGHAPQAMCIDEGSRRLFVKNFTDRTVSAVDISGSLINPNVTTIRTVANERLAADVLAGKQTFYDAANGRLEDGFQTGKMSAEGYISCATCHMDGGHDGRTYDFTGRGEGIRNNISLKGREGTRDGNVHWTANFDEIQDFEHDIRGPFRGRGFMSDSDFADTSKLGPRKAGLSVELDNIAAYVTSLGEESLPRSPYRDANGNMTAAAVRGETLFSTQGCINCHSGYGFTNGSVEKVGTIRDYSGAPAINGIKVPSLLSVFDSAPYLHDGSAKTLSDVFSTVGGSVFQAEDSVGVFTSVSQANASFSYLRQGAGVSLPRNDGYIDVENVDGGFGGEALVRVRYGSSAAGSVLGVWTVGSSVQGSQLQLDALPQVDGQDVSFSESSSVTVQLQPGPNNTIRIWLDSGSSVIIDDVTVSNAMDVASASSHTIVRDLSESDQADLEQYLLQLDRPNQTQVNSQSGSSGGSSSSGSTATATAAEDAAAAAGSLGLWFVGLFGLLSLALRKRGNLSD